MMLTGSFATKIVEEIHQKFVEDIFIKITIIITQIQFMELGCKQSGSQDFSGVKRLHDLTLIA